MTTRQPLINHRGKPTLSDKPAIEAYLRERIDDGSGLFFTGQKGQLTRWTLGKMFRSYCQQVSSARVSRGEQAIPEEAQRFHAIKHTPASRSWRSAARICWQRRIGQDTPASLVR
jgi:hypothetical protein